MTNPTVEILSQGDEVLQGQVTDTNASWLAQRLTAMGFSVVRHSCIGDDLDAIATILQEIAARSDICICSGGLGPTTDDLTAESVSLAFGLPLIEDPEALEQITRWFEQRGRVMPLINQRQALIPEGARRLDNLWGTAPGFTFFSERCRFYFVPGVPREMMAIFQNTIHPELFTNYSPDPGCLITFHTVGLGESTLQEKLNPLQIPQQGRLGFRAKGTENEVKITLPSPYDLKQAEGLIQSVKALLGESVYNITTGGTGDENLLTHVAGLLRTQKTRIRVHESLSQGLLSLGFSQESISIQGEVHPAANPPAIVETDELIERQLRTLADHLVRKGDIDTAVIERWYPEGQPTESGRMRVTFWTLAATESKVLVEKHTLSGTSLQLADAARVWSLNTLRKALYTD
jgi:competence/damage-inducible protein CinA-like protein